MKNLKISPVHILHHLLTSESSPKSSPLFRTQGATTRSHRPTPIQVSSNFKDEKEPDTTRSHRWRTIGPILQLFTFSSPQLPHFSGHGEIHVEEELPQSPGAMSFWCCGEFSSPSSTGTRPVTSSAILSVENRSELSHFCVHDDVAVISPRCDISSDSVDHVFMSFSLLTGEEWIVVNFNGASRSQLSASRTTHPMESHIRNPIRLEHCEPMSLASSANGFYWDPNCYLEIDQLTPPQIPLDSSIGSLAQDGHSEVLDDSFPPTSRSRHRLGVKLRVFCIRFFNRFIN